MGRTRSCSGPDEAARASLSGAVVLGGGDLEAPPATEGIGATPSCPLVQDRQFLQKHHLLLSGNGPLGNGLERRDHVVNSDDSCEGDPGPLHLCFCSSCVSP